MRSAELDQEVFAFLAERRARTAEMFSIDQIDTVLPRLAWGDKPEYRAESVGANATILVDRHEPDWWRIRYQVTHEVFHWLCTPPGVFHWTHELFAVETAVRAMQELGEDDYGGAVCGGSHG